MNAKEYGHHAGGYRKADGGPSRRFMRGLVVCAVVLAFCVGWILSHAGCAHPIGNGICAFVAFLGVPIRLMALLAAETGID